jgi:hypothetical protein
MFLKVTGFVLMSANSGTLARIVVPQFAFQSMANVPAIRQRRNMLDGICKEAIEILRNIDVCAGVFAALKKMKPIRQIEAVEQMLAAGTYSVRFAQALLEVTRPEFLVETALKRKPT